jgi:hypothetical protein
MRLKVKSLSFFGIVITISAAMGLSQVLPVFGDSPSSTERVSVSSAGTQGNGNSGQGASGGSTVTTDGRYVVFESTATNLVDGAPTNNPNIYLHDNVTGETTLVQDTGTNPSISGDGQHVTFSSNNPVISNFRPGVFVKDLVSGTVQRIDVAPGGGFPNGSGSEGAISSDGRYVAFSSIASNLVLNDTNNVRDVFIRDLQNSVTSRVSISTNGSEGNVQSGTPTINDNGRFIVFTSQATNLVNNDFNNMPDKFLHDRQSGLTERISVDPSGNDGNLNSEGRASISTDGRYVVFNSRSSNLVPNDLNGNVDIFMRDRVLGSTELVGNLTGVQEGGTEPSISSDGRYISFISRNSFLVSPDTNGSTEDVFVYDRQLDSYELASVSTGGVQENAKSVLAHLSSTGRFVAFTSSATNLVPGDTNSFQDVFLRDRGVFDDAPPVVSNLAFSANPKGLVQNSTLSADATDENGVQRVEYYLNTDPGQGNGTEMTLTSGDTYTAELGTSIPVGTYQVYVRALDTQGNWSTPISEQLVVSNQLISVSPANVWVGLKNSDSVGVKFDFLAEAYIGENLITSGQLDSAPGGSSGFNNAKLNTVAFDAFSPVNIPQNAELKVKLYVRNACVGSGHNSGIARLWYNDSAANSRFDATVDANNSDYYLLDGFLLSTSPGPGPKKTIDVQSGAKCSPFKPFGTWSITL